MSYLLQYARRPVLMRRSRRGVRVDERTLLNRPGFYGGAFVRVFVEDTSAAARPAPNPEPRLRLRIGDCDQRDQPRVRLETAELRENSLHKIDTLLGALHRFRDGLQAEAELAAERARSRAHNRKEVRDALPEAARTRRVAAVGAAPGLDAGAEQRRRLRLGRRRLDAAAPLPRPRLRGRQLLRARVEADARERAGGRALPRGGRRAGGRGDRARQRRRAARRRTTRRCSRSRWRPARTTSGRGRPRSRRCARVARTGTHLFQFAQFVEGFRGWGRSLRRAVGALVRVASRSTRSPTRRSSTGSGRA